MQKISPNPSLLKRGDNEKISFKKRKRGYLNAGGYKPAILVNFSKSKVEYPRILIR